MSQSSQFGSFEIPCPQCGHVKKLDGGALHRTDEFPCEGCNTSLSIVARSRKGPGNAKLRQTFDDGSKRDFEIALGNDGVWLFANDDERLVVESIELASDRAAAIIAGSIIESRVTKAVLARCSHVPDIESMHFHPSGAMGSFRVKIDLALMLNIITLPAYKDLMNLKDIRNMFAHRLDIRDFTAQRIKDRVKNFGLIKTHVGELKNETGGIIVSLDYPAQPRIWVPRFVQRKNNPRHRFMFTAQLFNVCLASAEHPLQRIPVI